MFNARAAAAERDFSERVDAAGTELKKAQADHKALRENLKRETEAVQQSLRPTAEKTQMLERLKKSVRDASGVQSVSKREILSARHALESQAEAMERLNARQREHEAALSSAKSSASSASETYGRLRGEYEKLHLAIKKAGTRCRTSCRRAASIPLGTAKE